jgi:hypothetical protein
VPRVPQLRTSPLCRCGLPALPRVSWLWALPPREESFSAAMCSSAPGLASLPSWASTLPRGPDLTSPRGGLRWCHVPHGPQWAVDHRNKERPTYPRHAAELACVQSTVTCYRGAWKVCEHAATVRFNSATQTQLTTPEHGYSGGTTHQDGTTVLTMFSTAGCGDRTTPRCEEIERLYAANAVQDIISYS